MPGRVVSCHATASPAAAATTELPLPCFYGGCFRKQCDDENLKSVEKTNSSGSVHRPKDWTGHGRVGFRSLLKMHEIVSIKISLV